MLATTQAPIQKRLQDLEQMTTEQLMERLAEKLAITAEALEELGGIVRVLENRQVDLSVLRIGILPLLRKIAYGQLLPGLVARFAGKGQLLKYVQNLAIPDQKRLLAGEKMRVLLLGDGG